MAPVRSPSSLSLGTTPEVETVTRRRGVFWSRVLRPGDLVCAVEKSQGIKKGGLVRLRVIRIVAVWTERLDDLYRDLRPTRYWGTLAAQDVVREGFPGYGTQAFVEMFVSHMGGRPDQIVTRIEFEYV